MENTPTGLEKVQNEVFLNLERIKCLIGAGVFTHAYQWLNANRKTYPGFIYGAGKVAVGIALFTITAAAIHTGFGRIVEDIILQAGVCIILISFFCVLLIMAGATYQAGRQVWVTWDGETNERTEQMPLLIANEWQAPAVSTDVILARLRGESMADFTARVSAINPTSAIWYILIKEREMAVTIFRPGKGLHFERGKEPFLNEVPENDRPNIAGKLLTETDHQNESREYYEKYVTWFSIHWPRYATRAKYEADPENAHKTAIDILRATANIFLFMLFCLPAFGQESKTRQVDVALGTRIREIPEAGDKITFIFQEGSREKYERRTGDGASEYTALLQRTTGLMQYDDQGGRLVAVTKNGEVIARGPEIELVNTKPEGSRDDQMRPMWAREEASEPGYMSMPDSITSAAMFEGWKESIREAEDRTGRAAKPAFDFSWWFFGEIFVALFVLASVLWFFAKTASEEGIIGVWGETIFISAFLVTVHQNCSALLMCVLWIAESFIFIKGAHLLITGPMPIFISCLIWLGGIWLMRKTHNKIVPNIKGLAGAGRNMNRGINPYNVS